MSRRDTRGTQYLLLNPDGCNVPAGGNVLPWAVSHTVWTYCPVPPRPVPAVVLPVLVALREAVMAGRVGLSLSVRELLRYLPGRWHDLVPNQWDPGIPASTTRPGAGQVPSGLWEGGGCPPLRVSDGARHGLRQANGTCR